MGGVKDNLIMDIFTPEILKAIKQHYKMAEDSSVGYGIENFEVSKRKKGDYVSYHVLFNIEVLDHDVSKNKSKILGNDTLKFVLGFDKNIQIDLISYSQNDE